MRVVLLLGLVFTMTGCFAKNKSGSSSSVSSSDSSISNTSTPTPTPNVAPTPTATPVATATPSPTPVSEIVHTTGPKTLHLGGDAPPFTTSGGPSDASPGTHGSLVSIQKEIGGAWTHLCGGVLLSSYRVLTAAHCVDGMTPSAVQVIAGLHNRLDTVGSQKSYVTSIYVHENYQADAATLSNDLAILYLTEGFDGDQNVNAAILPADTSNDYTGIGIAAIGWGKTSCSNNLPDIAQIVNGSVLSTDNANSMVSGIGDGTQIWEKQLAYLDDQQSAILSLGADGGPVFAADGSGGSVLIGIYSWGINAQNGCPSPNFPTVSTRVSAYLDWISTNL